MKTRVFAWDSESFYSKELSITTLGAWGYNFHPEADHYLVSVAGSDGTRFVGSPKDAPWEHMATGCWVSHNVSHDGLVHKRLVQDGTIPDLQPVEWHCTADMTAYLGYPRSLQAAALHLLDLKLSKDTRDKMKGKRWQEMTPEFRAEVEQYALADADNCLQLWLKHSDKWPANERRLSRLTREQGWRGVRIDTDRIERGIRQMQRFGWLAEQMIPWLDEGAPALSYKRLVAECQKHGIPSPSSVAMDDEECTAWEEQYGRQYPWVAAMRLKRRTNALKKKLQTIQSRVREDGTVPAELKYAGTSPSLRWSGSGGFNLQNLSRTELFGSDWWEEEGRHLLPAEERPSEGIDLRACIIAREGCQFVMPDLSQIEPRVSAVITGDFESVKLMASGISPYEAHALATGMCREDELPLKKTDPPRYSLAKARVLALGYASGHKKFLEMAALYVTPTEVGRIFSAPVAARQREAYEEYLKKVKQPTLTALYRRADEAGKTRLINSWLIVSDYRQRMPKTVAMWRKLGSLLDSAVGDDLHITLPSGRQIHYHSVAKNEDGETTAAMPDFGRLQRSKIYGGAIFNHVVQSLARDVFAECLLRLDDAGYSVVFSVHDEAIIEAPLDAPVEPIIRIMSTAPAWLPNLPVASEAATSTYYTK